MSKYTVVALVGESGSGKDTLMKKVVSWKPKKFHEIISCTTRPMRENEKDGVNYYFLSEQEFYNRIAKDDFLEVSRFNNWNYGTCRSSLSTELPNIGVFNPEGIRSLKQEKDIDLYVYRIMCSDKERLLRQLNREIEPNVDEIVRRYETDKKDFAVFDAEGDYRIIDNETETDLTNGVLYLRSLLFKPRDYPGLTAAHRWAAANKK